MQQLWMKFSLSSYTFLSSCLIPQGVGMANKGPSYGLSRQVQDKIDSKYDPELEQILVEWITRQCGSGVGRPEAGKLGFQAWLKDGCVSVPTLSDRMSTALISSLGSNALVLIWSH